MRVLLQNSVFYPNLVGGAEHLTLLLARELSRLGHRVDVVCTSGRRGKAEPAAREVEGIDGAVYEGPSDGLLDLYDRQAEASVLLKALHHWNSVRSSRWEKWFRAHLARESYDLIHTNNLVGMGDAPWREAARVSVPLLHTLHDYGLLCPRTTLWRSRGESCERAPLPCRLFRRQKMSNAGQVRTWVAPTDLVMAAHERFVSLGDGARQIIPNAHTGEFPESVDPPGTGPVRLLFMGQLEEHKGIHLLLAALQLLWERGLEVECTLAGDGALAREVDAFAAANGGRCRYLGKVAGGEKDAALREASLLLFPSLWREPFGLGVVEAFAYGRPVIAFRGSGGPESLVRDGEDGRLVDASAEALAAAIAGYCETPEELSAQANAAWRRRESFAADRMARAYVATYEQTRARR